VHEPPAPSVPPDKLADVEPATAVGVPAQVFVNPLGVATTSPPVKTSVKPTPLNEFDPFGLLMVKVNEVDPLWGMLDAPKFLLITGGASTVRVAVLLTAPAPLCVEEIAPVVFNLAPVVVPFTFTLSVQLLLVATVTPLNEMLPEPATAVAVPAQVLASPFGVATTRPAGRASAKPTPVRATVLAPGFVMVKVNEVEPFSGIVDVPKALLIVGAAAALRFAEAVLPVPPLVELIVPVVLTKLPATVAVTFTLSVQLALVATETPVNETIPEPATAVGVPTQLFTNPLGVAMTVPTGNVSLNATPVRATVLAA